MLYHLFHLYKKQRFVVFEEVMCWTVSWLGIVTSRVLLSLIQRRLQEVSGPAHKMVYYLNFFELISDFRCAGRQILLPLDKVRLAVSSLYSMLIICSLRLHSEQKVN